MVDFDARDDTAGSEELDKILAVVGGLTGGLWGALLCGVAVMMLETLKEWILDTEFDWQDWLWTLGGSAVAVLLSVIGCDGITA